MANTDTKDEIEHQKGWVANLVLGRIGNSKIVRLGYLKGRPVGPVLIIPDKPPGEEVTADG